MVDTGKERQFAYALRSYVQYSALSKLLGSCDWRGLRRFYQIYKQNTADQFGQLIFYRSDMQ
jgi:hypothetical protein